MPTAEATATLSIVDGRVAMSAEGDVDLYLETPANRPLTDIETHATLRVVGDDFRGAVDLDAAALDALADALSRTQDTDGGASSS
jgi:hypothetical protein